MRRRLSWTFAGSLGMAVLAVLALGLTLFVATRALHQAEGTVVRGESDALLANLAQSFGDDEGLPTTEVLQRELAAFQTEGLRYLAVVERDGQTTLAEAGAATLPSTPLHPGELAIEGHRVRVLGPLGPRRGPRVPGAHGPFGRPPGLSLVVEFEPPVIQELRGDLTRISIVAAVAGAVLFGFAIAWSRSARRIRELEQTAAREQRLVALGSMASVLAHELKNPLASLKGHAQLLAEDLEESPKLLKKAERVVSEAERLEGLTRSLLDFVRDGPAERAPVAASVVVEKALHDLDASRVESHVDAHATLDVDETRLARALHNVIDNALQSDPDGAILLRATSDASDVVFTVRDHGPGIDPDVKLFEPFATTRVRGTGLGLSVVRRIVQQHGGTVTGETHPEGGALFTLRIPKAAS